MTGVGAEPLTASDGDVRIRGVRGSDLDLYLALRGDVGTMEHLGGPQPAEHIAAALARQVADVEAGLAWIVVAEVRTERGWEAAANVTLVRHTSADGEVSELGWMVLPAFRKRGVARSAVRLLLGLPAAGATWGAVEALPPTANVASNRLCAALGFRAVAEVEVEFAGQRFTCTRWRIEPPYRPTPGRQADRR